MKKKYNVRANNKIEESKVHLCNSCIYDFPTCKTKVTKFGNGIGNDNVIECDCYRDALNN